MGTVPQDIFDEIHALLKSGLYEIVLSRLCDTANKAIKKPFDEDENHAWYLIGGIFLEEEDWPKAATAYRLAIEDWGDDIDAYLGLAYCLTELTEYYAARDALIKAQNIDPKDVRVRYDLANAYFDLCDYKKAKFLYRSITEKDDPEIYEKAKKNHDLTEEKLKSR